MNSPGLCDRVMQMVFFSRNERDLRIHILEQEKGKKTRSTPFCTSCTNSVFRGSHGFRHALFDIYVRTAIKSFPDQVLGSILPVNSWTLGISTWIVL